MINLLKTVLGAISQMESSGSVILKRKTVIIQKKKELG